jgi:flagellar basal body-associated protein FliL
MPGSATAEVIFIAAMMILILVVSFGAVFFFFKTYKKEMRAKEKARQNKEDAQ